MRYILLVVDSEDGKTSTIGYTSIEQAFADAIDLMVEGGIWCWQIQDMGYPISSPDGVLEYLATPVAQSPNWHKMI